MTGTATSDRYTSLAREARIEVLGLIHRAGTSHIGSNFSCIDFATVLYENLEENDEVVWSAGWKAATIYYFLWTQGKITREQLDSFPNAPFYGLAETTVNGVHVSGGSMGHGLPVAVGMALARKRSGKSGTIYCIMSDGECNEGTTWESAAVAAHHQLDNLVVIVDNNHVQAMGNTEDILDIDIARAFRGFKWDTQSINGHDFADIDSALHLNTFGPYCIVADTIKGKGVSFMEGLLLYHYKNVDEECYKKALAEL